MCLSRHILLSRLTISNNTEVAHEETCDKINGLQLSTGEESLGTTPFDNEAGTCAEIAVDRKHYASLPSDEVASITKYFERPMALATGSFAASPGPVTSVDFVTTTQFRNSFTPAVWDRAIGAHGIRGKLKFTLVVTSTTFHQGIVSLNFQYGVSNANNLDRSQHFPLTVHLPNVRLNLSDSTMAILEVPYVSPFEYWTVDPAITETYTYGVVSVTNLTGCPIVAGQVAPTFVLYISMEDIELFGMRPTALTSVVLQSGFSNKLKEMKESKVISNTLGLTAIAGAALCATPAAPVGAAMLEGGAEGYVLARAMGYSKPVDQEKVDRMLRTSYAGDNHVDLPTPAFTVSPFQTNTILPTTSLGCTDEEHMNFQYILSKYSYIYRGTYAVSNATNTLLYATPVSPNCFWYRDRVLGAVGPTGNIALKTSNTVTENAFYPSTLCYLGDNFRYWRGGLRFRFSFATTKLHAGRVQVTFIPDYQRLAGGTTPTSTSVSVPFPPGSSPLVAPNGYCKLFDLKDSHTFEFDVPYISEVPYATFFESIGTLSMQVVNPLRSTSGAPDTVNFMVEVCACDDFEFATVQPSLMQAVDNSGAVSVTYQSGGVINTPQISAHVVGEHMRSVKQLIMMPDWITLDVPNATIQNYTITPWFKSNPIPNTTPTTTTPSSLWYASKSSRLASMYAFARGSTSCIFLKSGDVPGFTVSAGYESNNSGTVNASLGSFYSRSLAFMNAARTTEDKSAFRAIFPLYGRFMRYLVSRATELFGGIETTLTRLTYTSTFSVAVPMLVVRNTSGAIQRSCIGRGAADDATLSHFVGPPPVTVLNNLATTFPAALTTQITTW